MLQQLIKTTADGALKRWIESRLVATIQTTERMTPVGVLLSKHVVRQLIVHDEHSAMLGRSVIPQCEDTCFTPTVLLFENLASNRF